MLAGQNVELNGELERFAGLMLAWLNGFERACEVGAAETELLCRLSLGLGLPRHPAALRIWNGAYDRDGRWSDARAAELERAASGAAPRIARANPAAGTRHGESTTATKAARR